MGIPAGGVSTKVEFTYFVNYRKMFFNLKRLGLKPLPGFMTQYPES